MRSMKLVLPAAAVADDEAERRDEGQQEGGEGEQHPEGELGGQARQAVGDGAVDGAHDQLDAPAHPLRGCAR
jgi:hypothetical protein